MSYELRSVAIRDVRFGKEQGDATREKVMKALGEFLRPEFLGRVDEIVVFNTLGKEELVKIAEILIEEF